jgi:hypothetical protein
VGFCPVKLKHKTSGFLAIFLVLSLSACQGSTTDTPVIQPGASRSEVRAQLGEPEQIQDFSLPEPPFFGPQEGLTDLIPAGTLVEEWIYTIGQDALYIWFAGEEGQARDQWRVIETARYRAGPFY